MADGRRDVSKLILELQSEVQQLQNNLGGHEQDEPNDPDDSDNLDDPNGQGESNPLTTRIEPSLLRTWRSLCHSVWSLSDAFPTSVSERFFSSCFPHRIS